ncbi:MAG: helix-turn-helix transcriptional regulator [Clostridia bacterium]|nr:helix-turn-helix transcriptional regulator [Clostridia bacterium]
MLKVVKTVVYDSTEYFKNIKQTPKRMVEDYEIELYISGNGETYINDVGYKHESGNLVIAKPGQIRYSKNSFSCYCIHLSENKEIGMFLDKLPNVIKLADQSAYRSCFDELINIYHDSLEGNELLLQSKIYQLLHMIIMDAERENRIKNEKTDAKLMQKAIKYIEDNFNKPVLLCDIAESVHLSPIYFHKLFKIYTGKTPAEFLLNKRISAAKIYLLTTDFSVEEIAEKSGFSSLAYFDYKFKKISGITPTNYRKQKYGI